MAANMADASKLKQLRRSGLGSPPPIEEARADLEPEPVGTRDTGRPEIAEAGRHGGEHPAERPSGRHAMATRIDGRTLRRSGRTVQFATRVSPEFDERIREIARREGMLLVEVLEQALKAYEARR
jgi:hypothetical protein